MNVAELFELPACSGLKRINSAPLQRPVKVAHVVDIVELQKWVIPRTLLLSTGLSWPRDPKGLLTFGQALINCNPAAVILAVPKYFQHFPAVLAQMLDVSGIPALELPWDRPFIQVVLEIHNEILKEHAQELERSERLHRALTRAALSGNLVDVTNTLTDNLGVEVVILNADGQALTPLPPGAPSIAQAANALSRAGTAARQLTGGILVPIVLRGGRGGGVWIAGELDPPARRAAEHAATVAGLLLLAQRDAELTEARLGYAFVDTLLEGQFIQNPVAYERATRAGFDPDSNYTVAMLNLAQPLPLTAEGFTRREQVSRHLREVLVSLGTPPLISVNLNQIWFLLPEAVKPERVWTRLGWSRQKEPIGGMIYSRLRQGAANIAYSRTEVLSLATHGHIGQLLSYAEVLLPRVLSGDLDAQADLVEAFLMPLRKSRGGEALIQTIQVLCDTGFSQVDTAARLAVHPNTLRYRINRIETLTERSLANAQTRSLWWLALQLAAQLPGKN